MQSARAVPGQFGTLGKISAGAPAKYLKYILALEMMNTTIKSPYGHRPGLYKSPLNLHR